MDLIDVDIFMYSDFQKKNENPKKWLGLVLIYHINKG